MKKTYTATTPDGKHIAARTSKRDYKFATWVQFSDDDYQTIVGFSSQNKPVLQAKEWRRLDHGVVIAEST